MSSTAVIPTIDPPPGLLITNITVNGANVTLAWQGSGLIQVQQSTNLGAWQNVGAATSGNSISLPKPQASQALYRLMKLPPASSWQTAFGGTGNDSGQAVVIDPNGSILLAGYFQSTLTMGNSLTSSGGYDVILAKLDSSGNPQWAKSYGSSGNELPNAIALDQAGNIFVAGSFYGQANFGGSNFTSNGDADAFLAKYTPNGDHLWSLAFGANFPDVIKSVAVDSQGNVIVTGFFQGSVNVAGTPIFSWGNGIDVLLAKFSPDGAPLWVKNFYNAGTEYGNAVAVDPQDNIVLAGYFNGYVNFAGGQNDANLLKAPGGYLAKFSPAGAHLWSRSYGGPTTRFWSMAIGTGGDIGVSGDFTGLTDLGGGIITATSWGLDLLIAGFSGSDGTYVWSTPIHGFQASVGRPVAMSTDGSDFTLTGYFQGQYTFGTSTLTSAPGITDGFFARFSGPGIASAQAFGSIAAASGLSVSRSVCTGYFSGSAGSLNSAGGTDVILISK